MRRRRLLLLRLMLGLVGAGIGGWVLLRHEQPRGALAGEPNPSLHQVTVARGKL